MVNKLSPPRMYILIRNDLASMTPGRACAQASHAANECISYINECGVRSKELVPEWEHETGHFGTTIVLSANISQINEIFQNAEKDMLDGKIYHIAMGVTHDPEYAVRDGDTVHLIPLDTCMWIFGRVDDVKPYVENLDLY